LDEIGEGAPGRLQHLLQFFEDGQLTTAWQHRGFSTPHHHDFQLGARHLQKRTSSAFSPVPMKPAQKHEEM